MEVGTDACMEALVEQRDCEEDVQVRWPECLWLHRTEPPQRRGARNTSRHTTGDSDTFATQPRQGCAQQSGAATPICGIASGEIPVAHGLISTGRA